MSERVRSLSTGGVLLAIDKQDRAPIVRAAPEAVLVAVTDPPDPLADIAREASGHDRLLSTGTFLDSLRFRVLNESQFYSDQKTTIPSFG